MWPVKECTKLPSLAFQTHILLSAYEHNYKLDKIEKETQQSQQTKTIRQH